MKKINFCEDDYKCYIFSEDVNQVKDLWNDKEKVSMDCKIVNINAAPYSIRSILINDYDVDISRIDLLDHNKIFVFAKNFKKIDTIETTKLSNDKEILENLKKNLLILSTAIIIKLSSELPNVQNKKNAKYRNKLKQLNMLKDKLGKELCLADR